MLARPLLLSSVTAHLIADEHPSCPISLKENVVLPWENHVIVVGLGSRKEMIVFSAPRQALLISSAK